MVKFNSNQGMLRVWSEFTDPSLSSLNIAWAFLTKDYTTKSGNEGTVKISQVFFNEANGHKSMSVCQINSN